jgi:hypothetical protein
VEHPAGREHTAARLVLGGSLAQLGHSELDVGDHVVHLDQLLNVGFAEDQSHGKGQ